MKDKPTGKSKISSPDKEKYSKRAMMGQIIVDSDSVCPKCHHHKSIEYTATNSPRFGKKKCTKCGCVF